MNLPGTCIALGAVLLVAGCASATGGATRVYHCVATATPHPPPNTFATIYPLEELRYGEFSDRDRPTLGASGYCAEMPVPSSAYLRYRADGRVVERTFDLSSLTPRRVMRSAKGGLRTVEFFVDGERAEVRLKTIVPGDQAEVEVIAR